MIALLDKPTVTLPQLTSEDLIQEFTSNLCKYSYQDLFNVLKHEISLVVKIIVRAAIRAKENQEPFALTLAKAESRARQTENTRRKNFIRRTFKKWGLFAIQQINVLYPEYTAEMLPADLYIKRKQVGKKSKVRNDFRGRQLAKYDVAYHSAEPNSKEFNKICERIASLTYADLKRLPINLVVTLNNEKYLYSFPWNTDEYKIKAFHAIANRKGITHQELLEYRRIERI
jgi:hypothetical protein